MQIIQLTGTLTFSNNIKNLKIYDDVKLKRNPTNKISSDAIGAYTLDGLKIGYIPFKESQINIKSKYTISKINLLFHPPLILISCEFDSINFIQIEPECISDLRNNDTLEINNDIKLFKKYLQVSNIEINNIGISYQDNNYINLIIDDNIFYTVTKKYYEENIFKYDEFYKLKLIPKCIFQQFQIHRLEIYLKQKYKSIDSLLIKKIKYDNFEFIQTKTDLLNTIIFNNLSKEQENNIIKLIIQYNIEQNEYYNPEFYYNLITGLKTEIKYNLENFKNNFNNLKIGGLCYNHDYKKYCYIDLYDDNNIIDISTKCINKEYIKELLIKLIISKKNIINIYNPITGILYTHQVNENIKNIKI